MFRKILVTVLLAMTLVVSLAGIVSAQEEPPEDRECSPCPPLPFKPLEVSAEVLGMESEGLRDALMDGQTIAEIAAAQGVPLEELAEALLEPVLDRIQKGVDDGRITQTEAGERIANMTDRLVDALESGKWRQMLTQIARLPDWFPRWPLVPLSEVLGMDGEALRQALIDGKSVKDLAEEQGVAIVDVVDALTAPAADRLARAVEDGRLTQAEADERLASISERVTEQIQTGGGPGPVAQFFARHPRVFKNLRERLP